MLTFCGQRKKSAGTCQVASPDDQDSSCSLELCFTNIFTYSNGNLGSFRYVRFACLNGVGTFFTAEQHSVDRP